MKDQRERFLELLSPSSKNFMGSGLSMGEFLALGRAEKLAVSWCMRSRDEQKRHLQAVIALSVELARVREITSSATRIAEMAIESVIEGDWKMVEDWADFFTFREEHSMLRERDAETWSEFRELLLQVMRTEKEGPA